MPRRQWFENRQGMKIVNVLTVFGNKFINSTGSNQIKAPYFIIVGIIQILLFLFFLFLLASARWTVSVVSVTTK